MKNKNRISTPIVSGEVKWSDIVLKRSKPPLTIEQHRLSIPNSPLRNIDMPQVSSGSVAVITGENGTGKTKLIEYLATDIRKRHGNCALLPQFWDERVSAMNLSDFVLYLRDQTSPRSKGSAGNQDLEITRAFASKLDKLAFGGYKKGGEGWWQKRPLGSFSQGEQRMLYFIALTTIPDIDAIILDEPTNHMGADMATLAVQLIKDFTGSIIVASHDLTLLQTLSDTSQRGIAAQRNLMHLHLAKHGGNTTLTQSNESPYAYANRVYQASIKQGKRAL